MKFNRGQLLSLVAAFVLGFLLAEGDPDYLFTLAGSCVALVVGYFLGLYEQRLARPPSFSAAAAVSSPIEDDGSR